MIRSAILIVGLLTGLGACRIDSVDSSWISVGGNREHVRFSPVAQVRRENVRDLAVAWTYRTGELDDQGRGRTIECTPLMIDQVLYITTANRRVIALDAATGAELWIYDPGKAMTPLASGGVNRGVAYSLIVGLKATSSKIPLLGIGVNAPQDVQEQKVFDLAVATAEYIGAPGVVKREDVVANCDYVGDGYGIPTDSMNDAILLLARTEGLLFDPVYSGKALAGMLDLVRRGEFSDAQNIVFLHTGGSVALFAYADQMNLA